jgi:hypothetical protein
VIIDIYHVIFGGKDASFFLELEQKPEIWVNPPMEQSQEASGLEQNGRKSSKIPK